MFGTEKLPLEVGDRVAAINGGKIAKGRVVEMVADVVIGVTFAKGGDVISFGRDDVMLLYRPVQTPKGTGIMPFVMVAPTAKL